MDNKNKEENKIFKLEVSFSSKDDPLFDLKQEFLAWLFKKYDQPNILEIDMTTYNSTLEWALNG